MKSFLVVGAGRFGFNLARTLYEFGNEVLAIDAREEKISKIVDHVTHALVGDATDEDVLKSIGARNFECAVVSISEDIQASVLVTLMLKEMGVPYIVARATSEIHMRVLEKVGADKIVFPERDMSMKIALGLAKANLLDYIEMSDDYAMAEINVPEKWVGKTLRNLNIRLTKGINVMAVRKEGHKNIDISFDADLPFSSKDVVVVVGKNKSIDELTGMKR